MKNCVVQTEVMRGNLIASYPALAGKVAVIPQPAPEWFRTVSRGKLVGDEVILFYPAAYYAHKNHALIEAMNAEVPGELAGRVRFVVTYGQDRMVTGSIENVGRLDAAGCLEMYRTASALFFPSKAESYGLPLVEAMCAGLPVLCADLPYAHWLCGGRRSISIRTILLPPSGRSESCGSG
ncbi:MAG: glycosyltransferase [Opitutaceae bacterium]|nr:glycosyltransferase [Opitutaceae bacterium]